MTKGSWTDHPYGVEMRIAVVVVGIAGAVLVPKISNWRRRASEETASGSLRSLRESIKAEKNASGYPSNLGALKPPSLHLWQHKETSAVLYGDSPDDSGGWLYDNKTTHRQFGSVWINCTHTDTRGGVWAYY